MIYYLKFTKLSIKSDNYLELIDVYLISFDVKIKRWSEMKREYDCDDECNYLSIYILNDDQVCCISSYSRSISFSNFARNMCRRILSVGVNRPASAVNSSSIKWIFLTCSILLRPFSAPKIRNIDNRCCRNATFASRSVTLADDNDFSCISLVCLLI